MFKTLLSLLLRCKIQWPGCIRSLERAGYCSTCQTNKNRTPSHASTGSTYHIHLRHPDSDLRHARPEPNKVPGQLACDGKISHHQSGVSCSNRARIGFFKPMWFMGSQVATPVTDFVLSLIFSENLRRETDFHRTCTDRAFHTPILGMNWDRHRSHPESLLRTRFTKGTRKHFFSLNMSACIFLKMPTGCFNGKPRDNLPDWPIHYPQ